MRNERKIKEFLRTFVARGSSDKISMDGEHKQFFVESDCFVMEDFKHLSAFCVTHGLWFFVSPVDGERLRIVVLVL